MNTLSKEYLKLGKLMDQERQLREKLRQLQDKRLNGGGRWTCTEWHDNGVTVHVPLPELMALCPDAKTDLVKWTREDGSIQAYTRFGPAPIGEIRPGFWLWVKHETKTSEVSPATIIEQTATQKAA